MQVSFSENIRLLEEKIEYKFRKKSLIREALTHKSFASEDGAKYCFNERVEFLGDAVLGLIVSEYLFNSYPDHSESSMSKIKAYAVREATLAEVSSKLGLGSYLLLGKGEESSGGRKKPSLLANVFEAVLAAVYLDGGYKKAKKFAIDSLNDKIRDLVDNNLVYDFKSRFQEIVQEKFGILPSYRIYSEEGPEHKKVFKVSVLVAGDLCGTGTGGSKKEAEQQAARAGLKKLEKRPKKKI